MTQHFADRLLAACADKGAAVCVGLDPVLERLPGPLRETLKAEDPTSVAVGLATFCRGVIDAVADVVPCVKVQLACFERYGSVGMQSQELVIRHAKRAGLLVIADAKRGDIGISAAHYAAAVLGEGEAAESDHADAITVNSYFGPDGLSPFTALAVKQGQGVFALVRTSNPGGAAVQGLELADGLSVAEAVGAMVAEAGDEHVGDRGYSLLGAVVGATHPADAKRLRAVMPGQIFLVPGFGAQGGQAEDVRACFDASGEGALVTASRSVIYAFEPEDARWQDAVRAAAVQLRDQVSEIMNRGDA